jgi:flagellar motility protein MotE (MotC chaperone)
MGPMLPPSKLLRATIVATSVVLVGRLVAVVADAPRPSAVWSTTRQAVMVASVITDAHAAASQAPVAGAPPAPAGNGLAQPPIASARHATPAATAASPPAIQPAPRVAVQPAAPTGSGTGAGDATAEITLHRSQIETREQQLTQREAAVAAAEKQLTDRVAQLLAIQVQLQTLVNDDKEHNEAKLAGLVRLYEGMRPRDAAAIFNGLDKPVLLEILGRMKPAKAAPVLAAMEPENARQVTADLAAQRSLSAPLTN